MWQILRLRLWRLNVKSKHVVYICSTIFFFLNITVMHIYPKVNRKLDFGVNYLYRYTTHMRQDIK